MKFYCLRKSIQEFTDCRLQADPQIKESRQDENGIFYLEAKIMEDMLNLIYKYKISIFKTKDYAFRKAPYLYTIEIDDVHSGKYTELWGQAVQRNIVTK